MSDADDSGGRPSDTAHDPHPNQAPPPPQSARSADHVGAALVGEIDLEQELDSEPRLTRLSFAVMDAETLAPIFFSGLFLATIAALFYVLSAFLADAVVSFILLGLFGRPYRYLLGWMGNNRWLASAIMTFAVVVLLLLPLAGFLYAVVLEATIAFESVAYLFQDGGEGLIQQTLTWVEQNGFGITRASVTEYIKSLAASMNEAVVSFGGALFGNVLGFTVHAATVVVMIFYLFADGERLRDFLFKLSPLPDHEDALLVETFQKVSRGVIVGNGLGSAIQGALGGLAMWTAGISAPLLWGAVMAVFAFLPLIGIMIVIVPATLVLFFRGQVTGGIVFFGFCFVMASFVENIVKTKLMGSAMRMHDLLVFLSIIGGLAAFGVLGFVYGPLIAMLFITLHGLYETHYLPHIARSLGGRGLGRSGTPGPSPSRSHGGR